LLKSVSGTKLQFLPSELQIAVVGQRRLHQL
jgi:hypothetical protein